MLGLLWLSTVPPTSGLIAVMFGTRWFAMLFGFSFFSHQVGAFLGVWLGGFLFDRTGSYDVVWWLAILLGVLSAVINLPIVEKPVVRPAAVPGVTTDGTRAMPKKKIRRASVRGPPWTVVLATWRTPAVIVLCGCLIAMIGFGPRSTLGLLLTPMSSVARLGARHLRAVGRHADLALRRGAAVLGRDRRSFAHYAGDHRRRAALRRRHLHDGARHHAPRASYLSSGVLIGFGLSGCSYRT